MNIECAHTERYKNGTCKACQQARNRRKRRAEHKASHRAYNARWAKTTRGIASALVSRAIERSKEKGWPPPELNRERLVAVLRRGVCELSGLPLALGSAGGAYAPSLDRRDSALPYTDANVRVVLWALNSAFGPWGAAAFEPIARAWLRQRDLLGDSV